MHHVSRRDVLKTSAALGAAAGAGRAAAAPAERRQPVQEFDYADVRLTGGPMKAQYDRLHARYMALADDDLLKVYRRHAGLPAPGRDMGGWYDEFDFVPGSTFGQYVSGLARIGASTGDEACHAKVRRLVKGFGECLAANPNPFAGPNGEQVWPAYILDKHLIGLLDAWRYSGASDAKPLMSQTIAGALPYISPVSRDRVGKVDPPYDETYVLPENLFDVAEVTGDRRHHALAAHYLLDKEFFDPLAAGQDVLPGRHAYSHAIALSSAAKAYQKIGDPKYKHALENAWRFLELQRYASGGWGPEEQFIQPHTGALGRSLTATSAHFETPCGAYAATKLNRYLMGFTADPRYADALERVVYNTVLGARDPSSEHDFAYYSSYGPQSKKLFYPKKCPCCSGTLVQTVADYVKDLYFHSDDDLYVAMYAPSQLRWRRSGGTVQIVQETDYPTGDVIRLHVRLDQPAAFAVNLRIPGWLARAPSLRINGAATPVASRAGYAAVRRTWRDGDVIELTLPQDFRVEPIDEANPDTVAVMRGPVMYVGLDPWAELASTPLPLPGGLSALPGAPDSYTTQVKDRTLAWAPFHAVRDETYNTYFLKA